MYARQPIRGFGGFGGLSGPAPKDLLILLGVLFATLVLQYFDTTRLLPALLTLTPLVWQRGFLWQLGTYAFVGQGTAGIWFLLSLLIVYIFGKDVYWRLGRKAFWLLLVYGSVGASVTAMVVHLLGGFIPGATGGVPFILIQGQWIVTVLLIAAFATLFRDATIYLFFILPIKASWFLPLEILFGFFGFLNTRDLGGFAGICAGVAIPYWLLTRKSPMRIGRELWLRVQERWMRRRLDRLRRERNLRILRGEASQEDYPDDDLPRRGNGDVRRGPWVH